MLLLQRARQISSDRIWSNTAQSIDDIGIPESRKTSQQSEDDGESMFDSSFAPQDVKVRVEVITRNGKTKTAMSLVAGSSVESFMWPDWIDVAVGFIKGEGRCGRLFGFRNELNEIIRFKNTGFIRDRELFLGLLKASISAAPAQGWYWWKSISFDIGVRTIWHFLFLVVVYM